MRKYDTQQRHQQQPRNRQSVGRKKVKSFPHFGNVHLKGVISELCLWSSLWGHEFFHTPPSKGSGSGIVDEITFLSDTPKSRPVWRGWESVGFVSFQGQSTTTNKENKSYRASWATSPRWWRDCCCGSSGAGCRARETRTLAASVGCCGAASGRRWSGSCPWAHSSPWWCAARPSPRTGCRARSSWPGRRTGWCRYPAGRSAVSLTGPRPARGPAPPAPARGALSTSIGQSVTASSRRRPPDSVTTLFSLFRLSTLITTASERRERERARDERKSNYQ